MYILGTRAEFTLDYVQVMMEWQEEIPACFREENICLAEGVDAWVILLQPREDAVERHT